MEEQSRLAAGEVLSNNNQGSFPRLAKSKTKQRLENFEKRHGKANASKYAEETRLYRNILKQRDHHKRFVLMPDSGPYRKYLNFWDGVTMTALLYTCTLTPFEAAFIETPLGSALWTEPWFIANRVLDLIFLVDLILQFFLAFEERDQRGNRVWVNDQRRVVRHYLRSWFGFDAMTIFLPGGLDISLALGALGQDASNVSFLRTLRVIRLVKIVRLLRASRVWERWKARIVLSYGTQTILQCFGMMLIGAHWYACIMGLEVTLHANPQDTWMGAGRYGFCSEALTDGAELVDNEGACGISVGVWYVAAFSWSVMVRHPPMKMLALRL